MTTAAQRESTPDSRGLDSYSDAELLDIVQSLPRSSGIRDSACALLVGRYQYLVRSCIRHYWNSPELQQDLMQVGYVGLLKAINNFDRAIGGNLATYARPCISGEIKRHFRDNRWQAHAPRPAQELRIAMRNAIAELTQRLSRPPRAAELSLHLGVSGDEIADARLADAAFQAWSLDAPRSGDSGTTSLADALGEEDQELDHALNMAAVWAHIGELSSREQHLLMMRFYGNMTQAEIGDRLGVSQMHVSRLLNHALGYLRERIL
jgi:RNA polymerase sigma-B factor